MPAAFAMLRFQLRSVLVWKKNQKWSHALLQGSGSCDLTVLAESLQNRRRLPAAKDRMVRIEPSYVPECIYSFRQSGSSRSGDVDAGDASGHRAEKIGGDGADAARDRVGGMHVFAVGAVDGDDIADFDAGDVGDIDNGHIHGDDSDDGRKFAAHEHAAAAVTERAVNAVAVAGREHGDYGRPRRYEFCAIANTGAGGNAAQAYDARAQAHHRLQRQAALGFGLLLRRIVAGMIAVKNYAGADHVSPTLRARSNGGAVGQMHDAGVDAESAQAIERGVEGSLLLEGLLALRRARAGFGGGEVRHEAPEPEVLAFRESAREAFHVAFGDTDAVHAGVHFQMKRNRFARGVFRCGAI